MSTAGDENRRGSDRAENDVFSKLLEIGRAPVFRGEEAGGRDADPAPASLGFSASHTRGRGRAPDAGTDDAGAKPGRSSGDGRGRDAPEAGGRDWVTSAREIDGGGEDAPGGTGAPLLRLAPQQYADGDYAMEWEDRPGAREVSNAVFAQSRSTPNPEGLSDLLWVWGQFIDHDITLTEAHGDGEKAPIPAPKGDRFFDPRGTGEAVIDFTRVKPIAYEGPGDKVEHPNEITAFIDGSAVYGSTEAQLDLIRDSGGKVRLDRDGLIIFERDGGDLKAVAGDIRAGENVALSSMHALMAREHNRIVDALAEEAGYSARDRADPAIADKLFGAARAQVEAIIQAITYNDFLPKLIGEDALPAYRGYDRTVDPGIAVEFSTAVFRLGHTLLSAEIERVDEDGSEHAAGHLALRDAFFRPEALEASGIDAVLAGAAGHHAETFDAKLIDDVRNFLFGPPGAGGFDLAALNIQRGRDLGVASYAAMRKAMGLDPVHSFDEITSDRKLAARLASVYDEVEDVDLWVGGLAEDPVAGGLMGETFRAVMIDQFTRLRDGDPFWSEIAGFDPETLEALRETTLSDVILRNTDIAHLQDDAFRVYDRQGGGSRRDTLSGDDGSDLLIGFGGRDRLFGHGGDDHLAGDEGRDLLVGGRGNDRLDGGDGRDRLIAGPGDDVLTGGADRDLFHFHARDGGDNRILDFAPEDHLLIAGGRTVLRQAGDDVIATSRDLTVVIEDAELSWFFGDAPFG